MTIYQASQLFGIPGQTLRDRKSGKVLDPDTLGSGRHPALSKDNEGKLIDHVKHLMSVGYSCSRSEITKLATDYSHYLGVLPPDRSLTAGWFNRFDLRWPELKRVRQRAAEPNLGKQNSKGAAPEELKTYYSELEEVMDKYELRGKPQYIYFMDETAIVMEPDKVCAVKGDKSVMNAKSVSAQLTVVGCGNAAGSYLPPFLIFKGKKKKPELSEKYSEGTEVRMSESGWSDSTLITDFVTNHFYKHAMGDNSKMGGKSKVQDTSSTMGDNSALIDNSTSVDNSTVGNNHTNGHSSAVENDSDMGDNSCMGGNSTREHGCTSDNSEVKLLLYDGTASHINIGLIEWAQEHKIILFVLPPSTKSQIEVSEVGCFEEFKKILYDECEAFMTQNDTDCITKCDLGSIVCMVYPKALSPLNLMSAFKNAGIYPYDSSVVDYNEEANRPDTNGHSVTVTTTADDSPNAALHTNNSSDLLNNSAIRNDLVPSPVIIKKSKKQKTVPPLKIRRITTDLNTVVEEETVTCSGKPRSLRKHRKRASTSNIGSSDDDDDVADDDKCCVCGRYEPEVMKHQSCLHLVNWAQCEDCTHWVHLKFCAPQKAIRRHTHFLCPHCK